jgi:hypothetical protein
VSPHCLGDDTACTKILDWTPRRNFQQFDRVCNWFANVTTWLYSSEPVLHLRVRVQHATVAQRTNRHKIEIMRTAFERLAAQNQDQPAVLRKRPAVRKAVLQDVPAVD